jgi:transcriptional regulator with XRE-family HTH domain
MLLVLNRTKNGLTPTITMWETGVANLTTMPDKSKLAALFEAYGIGTRVSLRESAKRAGISRQTLSNILRTSRDGGASNVRQSRESSLRKIAEAFEIPFDHVKTAAVADWGQIKTIDAVNVQQVCAQIGFWHPDDLAQLQVLITRTLARADCR